MAVLDGDGRAAQVMAGYAHVVEIDVTANVPLRPRRGRLRAPSVVRGCVLQRGAGKASALAAYCQSSVARDSVPADARIRTARAIAPTCPDQVGAKYSDVAHRIIIPSSMASLSLSTKVRTSLSEGGQDVARWIWLWLMMVVPPSPPRPPQIG